MPGYFNDGSTDAPKLRVYLNLDTLADLPATSCWPGLTGRAAGERLRADGFEGVQLTHANPAPDTAGLPYCGLDRINVPDEADVVFARHAARGDGCLTLHLGWGIEDDVFAGRLVEAVLRAADRHRLPAFIETHRATITQDLWRTVKLAEAFPEARFNGDFSHYYCGLELVYGGLAGKLDFMAPIFQRIGFLHGRIASPGCMQMPVAAPDRRPAQAVGGADYLADFREMWTLAMAGFLRSAGPGDVLVFAPELLSPRIYYARVFPDAGGRLVEETDRYAQALIHRDLARGCFREAQARVAGTRSR